MRGIHADEQAIQSQGAILTQSANGQEVHHKGWRIAANSAAITKDAHMDEFASRVGTSHHLPEQLFGDNGLSLQHEASGLSISFNALDALTSWREVDLPPLQVRHAKNWQRTRLKDMQDQNVVTFKYDWTYTTGYNGSCGLHQTGKTDVGNVQWTETDEPMDKAILMQRDPIMFFADIPLYQSELDDCGASELSVKVRLMPQCWFVLLRFWLRVDGVMVRLRDTRYLCKFNTTTPRITREILQYEAGQDLMAKAGSSETHNPFTCAQTTADLFQAMAPSGTKLFRTEAFQIDDNQSAYITKGVKGLQVN